MTSSNGVVPRRGPKTVAGILLAAAFFAAALMVAGATSHATTMRLNFQYGPGGTNTTFFEGIPGSFATGTALFDIAAPLGTAAPAAGVFTTVFVLSNVEMTFHNWPGLSGLTVPVTPGFPPAPLTVHLQTDSTTGVPFAVWGVSGDGFVDHSTSDWDLGFHVATLSPLMTAVDRCGFSICIGMNRKWGFERSLATFTAVTAPGPSVSAPATLALFGLGLAGLGFLRRRHG